MRIEKFALLVTLAVGANSCSSVVDSTKGSGNIKTESRTVADFKDVEVSGNAKLNVQQGDMETLTITADDNLLQYLTSDVQNGKLTLGTKFVSMLPTAPIVYSLSVKHLNTLGVSGSVIVDAKNIHTDSLTVAVSGSGDISLSGEADAQKIAISGSADYKADGFKTKDTSVSVAGSGKAVIAASNRLDVEISGSGDVKYLGSPQVTKSIAGSGSVEAWTP